jgi:hypothetical protein
MRRLPHWVMFLLVGLGVLIGAAVPAQEPVAARSRQPTADADSRPPAPFIRDGTLNQNPGVGKLRGRTLRVKRPLLLVRDLERSIGFYVDLVGFELYSIEDTYDRRPESMGYALCAPGRARAHGHDYRTGFLNFNVKRSL